MRRILLPSRAMRPMQLRSAHGTGWRVSGRSRLKSSSDIRSALYDAAPVRSKTIRHAALITLRRAICGRFPPGPERTWWLRWAAHAAKPSTVRQRVRFPTERAGRFEQAYRDAIHGRASRCKQQSDTSTSLETTIGCVASCSRIPRSPWRTSEARTRSMYPPTERIRPSHGLAVDLLKLCA